MKFRLIILLFLLLSVRSFSQCCSQGTPMGGANNQSILNPGNVRVFAFGTHSRSIKQDVDSKYLIDGANFNFVGTNINIGITKRITFEGTIGYFINKSQFYKTSFVEPFSTVEMRGFGLSDAIIGLKGLLYKTDGGFELTAGLGAKIPSRYHYQVLEDGVQLSVDNQTSTIGFGVVPKLLVFKRFSKQNLSLFFINLYDINFKNFEQYRYGSGINSSLFIGKTFPKFSCKTDFIVELRSSFRLKDINFPANKERFVMATTGSFIGTISTQIGQTFMDKYRLAVAVDLPVYQKFNTSKLKNQFGVTASLVFDINAKKKKVYTNEEVKAHKTEVIFVNGGCEMCKERIENIALNEKGVSFANWNSETLLLTVKFDNNITSIGDIINSIVKSGHDSENQKTSNKTYNSLPKCCQYERILNE